MATESKQILDELKAIREELDYIKENMVDKEMLLTPKERELLEKSYKHEKEGSLIPSKQLREQMKA